MEPSTSGPSVYAQPANDVIVLRNIPKQPKNKIIYADFNGKTSKILGAFQIVFSAISIVFNLMAIYVFEQSQDEECSGYCNNPYYIGIGIWAPIFYLTSGSLAIVVDKKRNHRKIRALLGTSITSCLIGLSQASIFMATLLIDKSLSQLENEETLVGMSAALIICGGLEAVFCIWVSKLCGDHICCNKSYIREDNPVGDSRHNLVLTPQQQLQQQQQQQLQQQQQQQIIIPVQHGLLPQGQAHQQHQVLLSAQNLPLQQPTVLMSGEGAISQQVNFTAQGAAMFPTNALPSSGPKQGHDNPGLAIGNPPAYDQNTYDGKPSMDTTAL